MTEEHPRAYITAIQEVIEGSRDGCPNVCPIIERRGVIPITGHPKATAMRHDMTHVHSICMIRYYRCYTPQMG